MGYHMQVEGIEFLIREKNKKKALEAIKSLNSDNGSGGRWEPESGKTKSWFSWVDTEEFMSAETLEAALEAWRWPVYFEGELCDVVTDITDLTFEGEKLGDDVYLFRAIAPYVESGSYIRMRGEDNEVWRWRFRDGTCLEQGAIITFEWPE